jgi:FKBP-type peptidyl-prolyl cis-trans isomerase
MILATGLLFSCSHPAGKQNGEPGSQALKDSAVKYNREIVRTEMQEMDDYAARHHWTMKSTSSGLLYQIYQEGKGPMPVAGDMVSVRYSMNLLNGDLVGKPGTVTLLEFEIGKRQVIRGLEEGILKMNAGSRARLIVPSHLAYGLLGEEAVPSGSAIVIDVGLEAVTAVQKK